MLNAETERGYYIIFHSATETARGTSPERLCASGPGWKLFPRRKAKRDPRGVPFVCSAHGLQMPQENVGDVLAGGLDAYRANVIGHHGHAIDHAGILVLPNGIRALLPHGQQARGSVLSHAGHDDAHHLAADHFGHGVEHGVH